MADEPVVVVRDVNDPDRVYLSKRSFVAIAVIIGLAFATTIVVGAIALRKVGKESKQRSDDNTALIQRIEEIVHPTPAQYRKQLKRGIKLCLREPACRKLFPQLRPQSSEQNTSPSVTPALHLQSDTGGGPGVRSPFVDSAALTKEVLPLTQAVAEVVRMEVLRLLLIVRPRQ